MSALTLRQEKFVQALTTPNTPTFCNPSEAYRAASPPIKPESAWNGALRMSRNVEVQEAIRGQMNVGQMGSKLKKYLRVTEAVLKIEAVEPSLKLSAVREGRDTIMDYAKLTGQLIERREVKTVSDEDYQVIRRLVIEELAQRPSLRMATPDAAPTFSQPAALTLPPSAGTLAADSVTPTPSAIPVVAEERANG